MMPHFWIGFVIAALLFGRGVQVDIGKQSLERSREVIQETIEFMKPEEPVLKTTREAVGNTTDAIWKLHGENGTGTAFVIGKTAAGKTLLVTAAHCVSDVDGAYEHIRIKPVKVLGRDEQNDVALLEAPLVTPYRPITISQWRSGVEGEGVWMAGYGNGVWSEHSAVLKEMKRVPIRGFDRKGLLPETWITDEVAVPGHSGSPVVDLEERLVGVLTASGGGISVIVHTRYVRWLLESCRHDWIIDSRVITEFC